jgi:ATP-binding cassette, subfamily B, bacterial PglK
MLISSIAEIVSIGAVVPFLGVLISPEKFLENAAFYNLIKILNINADHDIRLLITTLFCALAISAMISRILLLWLNIKYSHLVGSEISCDVYSYTLNQPYAEHALQNSSEVISAITNKISATVNVIGQSLTLVTSLVLIFLVTIILFIASPLVALAAITIPVGIYIIIAFFTRIRLRNNGVNISREQIKVIKILQEGLGSIRDVILGKNQSLYIKLYEKSDRRLRAAQGNSDFIGICPRYFIEAIGILTIAILAYNLNNNNNNFIDTVPVLGALALGAQRLLPAIQQVFGAWSTIRSLQPQVETTLIILNKHLANIKKFSITKNIKFEKSITLSNISFKYSIRDDLVLDGITLDIPKGKKIALVGSTGSGKSTLTDIIMGLLDPTSGCIYIDNFKISDLEIPRWQNSISHVPQSIYLIDGSIAENIALGVPSELIDKNLVTDAASRAHLNDLIDMRAGGLDTIVGERGVRLSGGQRQRIGIARALYKSTPLLILDEATSALDNSTERLVMESIQSLDKSITIIIIAHRLTSIKDCDLIIELHKGKIVAQGSYNHLMKTSESFKKMAIINGNN